ncbi:MAG: TonB-dependent receptor-like protein [Sphingomonas bacterium]|nr:TonB-dependent receptor-like protein [Sphingomonas bacterium]
MDKQSLPARGFRAHALMFSASTAALLTAALAQPAFAQPAATPDETVAQEASQPPVTPGVPEAGAQDIVVTGSRIARRDFEANSPIVTANEQLFENSATSSIEANLNKLPQFTPANLKTPTTGGGDIQPTARNTPGSAAVSLRGIGTNRTLVLVNGRRATPADATGTVDINTIPTAAIERVEIISGGASSTYGADAVAGVTNFILKRNFQGLELDAQAGITERGDNLEFQFSGVMGTNFDEGRGNVTIALSLNERQAAFNRKRSWYKDLWSNPNIAGTGFFPEVPGVNLGFANPVNPAVMASLFPGANPAVPGGGGITLYANPNGTLFSGFDFAARGGASRSQVTDGYNVKQLATGALAANFTDALTVFPARRYNVYAQGNYDINDAVSVFFQSNFSNTQTRSVQEPAPVFAGWSAQVPYNPANPQANIPAQLRQVLNARAVPNAPFQIFQMLPFNRESAGEVFSYNMTAGLQGTIPGIDWTYELFGSQGKTQSTVTQAGFASLQRYRAIIAAPNFGQGFSVRGNAEQGGFGASTATCTSGLNPFGGAVSADCLEAIKADIKTKSTMQQTIWEGNTQGTLFALPAGDLKVALGASYRSNKYSFENDTLTTQGRSFIEQALGLYPAGNSSGRIEVKEAYGELLIPILRDIPAIQELNLELGGRVSDYNTTGKSYTYKILGDWKVTEWLRLRGGYNRAERAPNIAELYLAPEQSFAVAPGGDICSRRNSLPYSASPTANAPNAARVEALCRVLMARSGNANAATEFYGNPQPVGPGFVFPTLTGNQNLTPETADTWTAGLVVSSPFESAMFKRLRLSVDYYNIKVSDAIGAQSVDIAQRQCFDTAFNPTLDANSAFCSGINRNANGGLGNVITTFFNNGRFRTSGIDVALDWQVPVGPGQINFNTNFSYLLDMKSAELASLPLVDYVGTLGPNQNGLNGGSYEYRLFTTLGYSFNGHSLSLQWRHLPGIDVEAAATVPNNTFVGYPSYDLFNLIGTAALTEDVSLRFGVENLFDKAPPLGNINTAPNLAAGVLSGGAYNAQFYDIIGRRFYIGAKAKF